jgi:hypothetical protein
LALGDDSLSDGNLPGLRVGRKGFAGMEPFEIIQRVAGFGGGGQNGFAVPFQDGKPNRDIRRVTTCAAMYVR